MIGQVLAGTFKSRVLPSFTWSVLLELGGTRFLSRLQLNDTLALTTLISPRRPTRLQFVGDGLR